MTMTSHEMLEANLMSLVRIVDDLQKQITELQQICRLQDESIQELHKWIRDLDNDLSDIRGKS